MQALYHPNSGYYFTHYRVYDPETGRWLSRDPIGENGGLNLYSYVEGNPLSYTDPLGLSPFGGSGGGNGASCGDKKKCDDGYKANIVLCNKIKSPKGRALCYAGAMAAYAACLAGQL